MSVNPSLARRPSAPSGRQSLAARRRRRRRRILVSVVFLFGIGIAGILYLLTLPTFRISHIDIAGATDKSVLNIAEASVRGSILGIIPRDSIVFFPASALRANILAADRNIATVSIRRTGLTSIAITLRARTPIARWCGSGPFSRPEAYFLVREATSTPCYVFDDSGVLYATTTNEQLINSFAVYEPIASTSGPMHAVLPNAARLPEAFSFARQLSTLGSPVESVVIREKEIDMYLVSGTRVTYVLGDEQETYTALVSASDNLNLADGSIEYVDLRFDGKVYLKKKNASVP